MLLSFSGDSKVNSGNENSKDLVERKLKKKMSALFRSSILNLIFRSEA